MAARPPYLAMPYPLDEYLDQLPGDYGKVARALLRASNWERGPSRCGRFQLDAGEALMDERSEALWGSFRLDRDVSATGRRALVRRVLERLERDAWIARRAAQGFGPRNGPSSGPRNGPIPTVVRWLKFREILWPASVGTAQETAQVPAQETALANGPILPASPPAPPVPLMHAGAGEPVLGPLSQEFRVRLERGLGHGLVIASARRMAETAQELESVLEVLGVDSAHDRIATTYRESNTEPRSLAWMLTVLRPLAGSARAAEVAP